MKRIILVLLAICGLYTLQAQTPKTKGWKELDAFHNIMAATYHPAEEGNFQPLKEKIGDLYSAAKNFHGSAIPADYKPEETQTELRLLLDKVFQTQTAILNNASDDELMGLISSAHDIFHKISGECKKDSK